MIAPEDLVRCASEYARQAHQRIDQRRKYTAQPYEVHLKSVARLVASVTDDPETVAAAWLHDIVEDTPATIADIREQFGEGVAALVSELTDVSRPSDGNRAVRKAIDRAHLAAASLRAKAVKLADLIDNCRDICRHDPRFARVYLGEMGPLLEVLKEGDSKLYQQAVGAWESCAARIGVSRSPTQADEPARRWEQGLFREQRVLRLFTEGFAARDIAEPLASFDLSIPRAQIREALWEQGLPVVGLREHGYLCGYWLPRDLDAEVDAQLPRRFAAAQTVSAAAPLAEVIDVLSRHRFCFVDVFGEIAGVISRNDIQKPVVRMWLFGIVTLLEVAFVERIRQVFPEDGWRALLAPARLEKAQMLLAERRRRGQACSLLDCLQLSDKGAILICDQETLDAFELPSKGTAKRALGDLESLRNHLAHAQDIVTHDWVQIVRLARRVGGLSADRAGDYTVG